MTIAIAIRTSSAIVFAADSKVSTQGIVGLKDDGQPQFVEQSYDNAVKIAHDHDRRLMVMVAGSAALGDIAVTDYVARDVFPRFNAATDQDAHLVRVVEAMNERRRAFWTDLSAPVEDWPGTTLLLAAAAPDDTPRCWRVEFGGDQVATTEILQEPGIRLEGSYREVFTLLYGYEPEFVQEVCGKIGVDPEKWNSAAGTRRILSPIQKINLWTMPIQDAMDLAVFFAGVQVQMDRFLPGRGACGGPIDVMVLQTSPVPGIVAYPGKFLHHPTLSMEAKR